MPVHFVHPRPFPTKTLKTILFCTLHSQLCTALNTLLQQGDHVLERSFPTVSTVSHGFSPAKSVCVHIRPCPSMPVHFVYLVHFPLHTENLKLKTFPFCTLNSALPLTPCFSKVITRRNVHSPTVSTVFLALRQSTPYLSLSVHLRPFCPSVPFCH